MHTCMSMAKFVVIVIYKPPHQSDKDKDNFVSFQCGLFLLSPYRLRFLYYLFQMVLLTFALAVAARPELTDDQIYLYPAPIDYLRGICEVIVFIMMAGKVVDEIVEFAL